MIEKRLGRRAFLGAVAGALSSLSVSAQTKQPNIVIIFADDLGWGDVGCFGSSIPTPNLDQMAKEGVRMTRFYSASAVCSPSRAALLTGRYPARTGVTNVLLPFSKNGLSSSEVTISNVLKGRGYSTACVGKWHLGVGPEFTPDRHGFDQFYGIPYSNDMSPLPMLKNSVTVDTACDQASLTDRFTAQAVDFIKQNTNNPFFLYFSHTAPHIPLVPAERFIGQSGQGIYGDLVMELDWSVGEVMSALKRHGLDDNTLVIFTSDNGPWYQGSVGNLQGRKGSTYEGGVREPFIARMPGRIPAGSVSGAIGSTMDLLPTIAQLTGAALSPKTVDGVDMWSVWTGESAFAMRDPLLFFDGWNIQAVRWGPWKLHLSRYNSMPWLPEPVGGRQNLPLKHPELFNVDEDAGENYDRATEKPAVIRMLTSRVEELLWTFPDQVRSAWRDTKAKRVQDTPVGALPEIDT